jgi:hypothetical protein
VLCDKLKNVFTFPFTKFNILLIQFTSIAVTQLEEHEVPPSRLTAEVPAPNVYPISFRPYNTVC